MYIVADGKYGAFKNGRWNGMMADVVYGKADLALAALTITRERMDYADFTTPYMFDQTGIISKPQTVELDFLNWEFLAPLTNELEWTVTWVMIFTMCLSYVLENAVFFYNYRYRNHCRGHTSQKYYSFLESISHISGVTLQRDLGGKHPIRPGARVVCLTFAIGMVIVVSTYTAVLAAQSLKNQEKEPFKGSQDYRVSYFGKQCKISIN